MSDVAVVPLSADANISVTVMETNTPSETEKNETSNVTSIAVSLQDEKTTTSNTIKTTVTVTASPTATAAVAVAVASTSNTANAKTFVTTTQQQQQQQHLRNLPIELLNDQKRRSSSRSIKRKRFDDEIVEYSTSYPQSRSINDPSRGSKPRTISQTYVPAPILPTAILPAPTPCATTIADTTETTTTPTTLVTADEISTTISTTSVASTSNTATTSTPEISTVISAPQMSVQQESQNTANAATDRSGNTDRRRPARTNGTRRARRTGRPPTQITTKDLGRWKPIDDLALIIGIQQTNDLKMVHRGVKFSCRFTIQELQARWYALLFEPAVSRIAVSAMRNLHPELIESVQRKALFSFQEEELLGTIKSSETPKLENFQELLDKHASVFYTSRSAKSLHNHWMLMKQYSLLPDQIVKPLHLMDSPLTFSDAEDQIYDAELHEQRDEAADIEMALQDRHSKRKIRLLENELTRWGVLVDSVLGSTAAIEFDNQTLACLRGRLVRYLMRSKEITFGRDAKDCFVDVDFSLEGAASKISRRQGTIKLRSNGDFFIANEGKRAIFIDGVPLLQGSKTRLAHNCTVEIAGLRFAFLVNYELINAIRQESAKTPNALN